MYWENVAPSEFQSESVKMANTQTATRAARPKPILMQALSPASRGVGNENGLCAMDGPRAETA